MCPILGVDESGFDADMVYYLFLDALKYIRSIYIVYDILKYYSNQIVI